MGATAKKLCLGRVVTIILEQVVTTVTTFGRPATMAWPASSVLTIAQKDGLHIDEQNCWTRHQTVTILC